MRGSCRHVVALVDERRSQLAGPIEDLDFLLSEPLVVRLARQAHLAEYTRRQFCAEFLPDCQGFSAFEDVK